MSALHPQPDRGRRSRRQLENDRMTAALSYGLDALAEKVQEQSVRAFQSVQGIMLQGARAVFVGNVGNGATLRPTTAEGSLVGWSFRNTGATAALVYVRDGVDATGHMVAVISLAVGESTRDNYAPGGIHFGRGLFLDVNAGTVEGVLYLRGPE